MIKNYKGYPTYHRDRIKWEFDPKEKKKLMINLLNQFKEKYYPSLQEYNYRILQLDDITIIIGEYIIRVNCFFDGWYIHITDRFNKRLSLSTNKKIFGDINENSVWTQQTDMVPVLMGKIYKELEKLK